ncbi:uncharacterized protein GGS22DRAFT_17892 [Annulohypoxylon maeteangense]|uniref:uncharacterized protein n=1 Tax=Annulohypoxylon maeteangense TaxID=1927788 RepID=UPI0020078CBC|nr:uncharacterized protein GGS22DRAFT_17892 [Annulohypoxylon maeteangense]KAI0890739.1 hypothetical protein GGS22DRAFT_17892 [Annulohypoxylon maeteangense]
MGLSGPRNRRKIQHDPNNTKWSRDETTFGQRILRAQGWEPGKFLGAQDASHSHLHSAASAAPINVLMKDDTLGLGAKPKHKQNTECTGLDVFKDLLGRLNGKSEEVIEKEREVRSGIKTNLYVEKKYGLMRFVSGGFLVGDQMNELTSTNIKTPTSEESGDDKSTIKLENSTSLLAKKEKKEKREKKSKKRKAEDSESTDSFDAISEKKRKKRSKDKVPADDLADTPEVGESSKKSKKSKRKDNEEIESTGSDKKKRKSKKSRKDSEGGTKDNGTSSVSEDVQLEKSLSKEEKRARKKEKKAKKQKQLETPDSSTEAAGSTDTSTPIPLITPQESGASTPVGTGTSTPQALSARHYARSRHIASKRMAMADMAALNQIFMVKPV